MLQPEGEYAVVVVVVPGAVLVKFSIDVVDVVVEFVTLFDTVVVVGMVVVVFVEMVVVEFVTLLDTVVVVGKAVSTLR